jgi:predicted nucleic acid-binding protein
VRYFLRDNPDQGDAGARLIESDQPLAISCVALSEVAFVLFRIYRVPRDVVVDRLTRLLARDNVRLLGTDKRRAAGALQLCRDSGRVNFADALIFADTLSHGVGILYTFDRRFPSDGLDVRVPS